jgi:hypothetical protein
MFSTAISGSSGVPLSDATGPAQQTPTNKPHGDVVVAQASGANTQSRFQGPVAKLTPAEREFLDAQKNQWGMVSSTQPDKDLERVALLNRIVGNSSSYKDFPGASHGARAAAMRDKLFEASRVRDDALRVIHESGQKDRPFTLLGLGKSELSEAWDNRDRANTTLNDTRYEIDQYLNWGGGRRYYLEPTDPKRLQ